MKTCLKCKKQFKTFIKIDGKDHVLGNRKFCLDCSPFKLHNTKNLTVAPRESSKEKTCPKCGLVFKNTSEFFYNTSKIKLSCYCKKCNTVVKVQQNRKTKALAVEYLGGKCVICDYSKHISALDFHHIDPSKKERQMSSSKSSSFNKIKPELDKCILLCSNCHRETHSGLHPQYLIVKDQS